MYKIFINNKPIILTDKLHSNSDYEVCTLATLQVAEVLHKLKNTKAKGFYIYNENIELVWTKFKQYFVVVEAAGGLVLKNKSILLIYRNGFWDLPKGKMEKGETTKNTALREVEEECGIKGLNIKKKLPTSYHVFFENNAYKLKVTYWFLMNTNSLANPKPQLEEGITKAVFVPVQDIEQGYKTMYRSIAELIESSVPILK